MLIRQNCEDHVIKVNDLHRQISASRTPIRRVSVSVGSFFSFACRSLSSIATSRWTRSPWASWRSVVNSSRSKLPFNCRRRATRTITSRSIVRRSSRSVSTRLQPTVPAGQRATRNERRESSANGEHGTENSFIRRHWPIPTAIN